MKLHLEHTESYRIRAYGPGYFVIGEERLSGSVVLTRDTMLRDAVPAEFEALGADALEPVRALGAEIILIGTGGRQRFPPSAVTRGLFADGAGVEVMDTAAACRTFNILAAEERRVAAVLLPIEG